MNNYFFLKDFRKIDFFVFRKMARQFPIKIKSSVHYFWDLNKLKIGGVSP